MKKLNLNCKVKVKLSDRGRDIYYHQFDDLIDMGIKGIKQSMPEIDKDGFSEFQLWHLMELYGPDIIFTNAFKDISIYIDENDLKEV